MASSAVISEVFLSVQGEGRHIGVPMVFVRVAHCNIECQWCDTPQRKDGARRAIHTLQEEVRGMLATSQAVDCCLTGGEPMLQLGKMHDLFVDDPRKWSGCARAPSWHLETNGTLIPDADEHGLLDQFRCITVSPKLTSARVPFPETVLEARPVFDETAFAWWAEEARRNQRVQFKFVLGDEIDWRELNALLPQLRGLEVVLQPQTKAEGAYASFGREVWTRVHEGWGKEHGVRFRWMPRLHEVLWGHTPGR